MLLAFFGRPPLLGKPMYQEVIMNFDVSLKAAMGVLPIAISVQFVVFNCCPLNRAQAKQQ